MKNCVSLETAKALKEAGFGPSLENPIGFYYIGNFLIKANSIVDLLGKESSYAPSAVEILDQMDTHIQLSKGRDGWICKKGEFFEVDICPHEAAAKMFIERKKYGHDKIQKSTKP